MSLLRQLEHHFSRERIYPTPADRGLDRVFSVRRLVWRWPDRKEQVDVIAGHFPLCTIQLLGDAFEPFTLLRDPVERTLSYLRYARRRSIGDRKKALEDIYEEPRHFREFIQNHMVKMLSMTPSEMTDGIMTEIDVTRDHLDRAQRALQAMDVVGLQSNYQGFCDQLASRYGLDLGPVVYTNQTPPIAVSPAFRERIAWDNRMDGELYQFARDLVASRTSQI